MTVVIDGCAIATSDPDGTEYGTGHLILSGGRIQTVASGRAPELPDAEYIDASGCLATAGLVNTHHHLYQWATQGLVQQATLFEWLTTLYPLWSALDEQVAYGTTVAGLAWLARSGCTTSTDHPYVFGEHSGDPFTAQIEGAAHVGVRFHPCRGSMDRGRSSGGLPPDHVVEDRDTINRATVEAIDRFHDPDPDAMVRVAVAPCSPFSVSTGLLTDAAELARSKGVRLHTHLAETIDEEEHCREQFGCTPAEYLDKLGWLGSDVWLAHCVHLSDAAIERFSATGTGVAHCPSSNGRLGTGVARTADLMRSGVPVGLGVDGPASSELTTMSGELRQALLMARSRGGPDAMTARQALDLGTIGGARCLGRENELGSLQVGKLADVALWDVGGFGHDTIEDPVAALVFGPTPPLRRLLVGGRTVVREGVLATASEDEIAAAGTRAVRRLRERAQEVQ